MIKSGVRKRSLFKIFLICKLKFCYYWWFRTGVDVDRATKYISESISYEGKKYK